MFVWICTGQVRHAIVVGTHDTACCLPLESLNVSDYNDWEMTCETCAEVVRRAKTRRLGRPEDEEHDA